MRRERIKIIDETNDKKYFAIIPYFILNHSSVWDRALYIEMKRIAGENGSVWASEGTLAKRSGMSRDRVRKSLKYLLMKRWIEVVGKRMGKTKPVTEYRMTDIWKENVDFYSRKGVKKNCMPDDYSQEICMRGVQKIGMPGVHKEEPTKEEPTLVASKSRQDQSFNKDDYSDVLKEYQSLKGITLQGKEFDPVMRDIKTMFMSNRSVSDIISFMRWLQDQADGKDKKYEWTRNWTIKTVRMKLPEFIGGAIGDGKVVLEKWVNKMI